MNLTVANIREQYREGHRDFSNLNLEGVDLRDANLAEIDLRNSVLRHANLTGSCLDRANLSDADLSEAILDNSSFQEANLTDLNLSFSSCQNCEFHRSTFQNVNFVRAKLRHSNFQESVFKGSNLSFADFQECDFTGADLSKTDMTCAKFDAAIFRSASLDGANLERAYATLADFSSACITNANFMQADCTKACFKRANLANSRFEHTRLRKADLRQADLSQANLKRCNVQLANLESTNLQRASLKGASIDNAIFTKANLRGAFLDREDAPEFYDAEIGKLIHARQIELWFELENRGSSMAFCDRTQLFACLSTRNREVEIYNLESKRGVRSIGIEPVSTVSVIFSKDGLRTDKSFYINQLRLWDLETGQLWRNLTNHTDSLSAMVLNSEGKFVGMSGTGEDFELFDVGHERRTFLGYSNGIKTEAISPDGNLKAISSPEHGLAIQVIDTQSQAPLFALNGHRAPVQSLSFSPDGKSLASYTLEDFIIWDIERKAPEYSVNNSQLRFSPFLSFLYSSADAPTRVVTSEYFLKISHHSEGSGGSRESGVHHAISQDGRILAKAPYGQSVYLWNLLNEEEPSTMMISAESNAIALNSDGSYLAISEGRVCCIWDTKTGEKISELPQFNAFITALTFNPESTRIAVGERYGQISLWDWQRQEQVASLTTHAWVKKIAFSAGEPLLIGLGDDGLIRFWETKTYTETYLFKCDEGKGQFINIELSPNGQFLACGNYQSIKIYKLF